MPRTLPAGARPAWRWLVRLLVRMRVVTKADGPVLVLAACRLSDYFELRANVDTHGRTFATQTTTGSTMVRQRPEVTLMTAAWRDAMQALGQLGLTPVMRSRVSSVTPSSEPDDELEGFLGGRGPS